MWFVISRKHWIKTRKILKFVILVHFWHQMWSVRSWCLEFSVHLARSASLASVIVSGLQKGIVANWSDGKHRISFLLYRSFFRRLVYPRSKERMRPSARTFC